MIISILGCGWYGKALGIALLNSSYDVKGSTTSADKIDILRAEGIKPYLIDLSHEKQVIDNDFFACDVLWICIPPRARAGKGAEYLLQINQLIPLIKQNQIKHVVLISSTGVYGDNNATVNELNHPEPDSEAGKILLEAEQLLSAETAFTTTIIRFGGLFGPGRDPGRFFAGKTDIPNGDAPVNMIDLTDCIGVSLSLLEKKAFGNIFNAVSPQHPTRAEFYTQAAKRSGLAMPQFIAEKKNWKIVESVNVPTLLQYAFRWI
ncbi:SDR family oxidoreductase [Mucilaginibacter auburnensis]|uniref:Nucleoside-diphosphate-sugar epimerase n=1 Tax=Mucilaginibacter auburnensis TaxID=1457233 RepID=A0A2H9VVN2_9SPHI|nr:SDR family oxidoreductase [Mucilaginibacter auburnensis]PJJ84878.1 nucleoside-diphosphate-sugar epimerase [Mucilaginibacter auburnensis]